VDLYFILLSIKEMIIFLCENIIKEKLAKGKL